MALTGWRHNIAIRVEGLSKILKTVIVSDLAEIRTGMLARIQVWDVTAGRATLVVL